MKRVVNKRELQRALTLGIWSDIFCDEDYDNYKTHPDISLRMIGAMAELYQDTEITMPDDEQYQKAIIDGIPVSIQKQEAKAIEK